MTTLDKIGVTISIIIYISLVLAVSYVSLKNHQRDVALEEKYMFDKAVEDAREKGYKDGIKDCKMCMATSRSDRPYWCEEEYDMR